MTQEQIFSLRQENEKLKDLLKRCVDQFFFEKKVHSTAHCLMCELEETGIIQQAKIPNDDP